MRLKNVEVFYCHPLIKHNYHIILLGIIELYIYHNNIQLSYYYIIILYKTTSLKEKT